LSTKKNIILLNDETHHCYRRKPDGEDEALTGDERIEANQRDEEARVWRSAYSRPGDAEPYCYVSDVPKAKIDGYRAKGP
jgi:hypothetical protein